MAFTIKNLADDFRTLGVENGDIIYLHSSLKCVGECEHGADTVLDALLEAVGTEGTLAVPTHTYSVPGNGKPPFSPDEPSVVGHITNVLRQRDGAVRSNSATHSSAAVGKYAKELMEHQCMSDPLAPESPLAKLAAQGGKILLLGVDHTANTILHLAETLSGVGYTAVPFSDNPEKMAHYLDEQGQEVLVQQTVIPGCSRHFNIMEGILKYSGITHYGLVGNAVSRIMSASEVVEKTAEIVRQKPDFLLCYDPNCTICGRRREFLKEHSITKGAYPHQPRR